MVEARPSHVAQDVDVKASDGGVLLLHRHAQTTSTQACAAYGVGASNRKGIRSARTFACSASTST